ncbi:hypothetical protein ABH14_28715 [Brevibacillus brevis]|uniref:hypothetical protein n=1 Tax=Brevibacillus brevis TaxID=1393 RepID=UPI001900D738|nr:hypothetical protein [Brevibacillus brevis]MBH0333666.1 hypothetical protein [Brevibacillus brevis]
MRVLRYALLIIVFFLSYWAGYYSYESALWLVWKQTLGGDKRAVLFWTSIAYLIILVPLFLLVCYTIKSKLKSKLPRFVSYPIFCASACILPTAFIMLFLGGGSFFSAESLLFCSFFASSGISFGLGYGLISLMFEPKSME